MPSAPLIATKLHMPLAPADLVPRPQLFQLLEGGLKVPLTLVSAPPGFGKSMLVAGWLHSGSADLQQAWLALDESDNTPGFFWRYFIAALQSIHAGIGETAQAMLSAPGSPQMQTVLTALINELTALESPLLFVLDDYHLIQTPSIHENMRFFLDHLPANAHLVVLTREDPPLGLARRRARRQMVEIRAADLRFDTRETTDFLNGSCRLGLAPGQIDTLEERTEGWIAGLQMAALSLKGRDPARFFESFTGDNRYIADYLIEEVLQRQPEQVRTFLLKTSILERLSAALCATVAGEPNARESLDTLERANLFLIPLDDHREWYRYHHLFAELLRQRLRETIPAETIADLHRAASTWYETEQDIPAAVRHARQIPDENRARQLLERYAGTFFDLGTLPQLAELADAIPPAQRETLPSLCAAVAWATLASNDFEAAGNWLKAIERHFALPANTAITDAALDPARRAALLEVLVIRLQLPAYAQTSEHILAIREQLNALPPDQPCLLNVVESLKPVIAFNLGLLTENGGETALAASAFSDTLALARAQGNRYLYHLGRAHLAALQAAMGQLHAARQTCEQGLAEDAVLSASPFLSLLHAELGALHYEWNDISTAGQHFNAGLALASLWNLWESRTLLILGLARLKQREGDFKAALHLLDDLGLQPIENLVLPIEAYRALVQFLSGAHAEPAAWLAAKMSGSPLEPAATNEAALLDVARLMVLLQYPAEAATLLERIRASAQAGGRTYTLLRARVSHAKALAIQGKMAEALAELLEILPLAAPEGYISTFVDEGEIMRHLLHEARGKIAAGELRAYVEQVLAAFAPGGLPPTKRDAGYGVPDLSDREREILSLVATGLSNQEIAERLVISITTVKTHVGNIFNKLGVTSRIQAIARAEGLGLLPRR